MTTPVTESDSEQSQSEEATPRAILGDTKPVTETGVNPIGGVLLLAFFAWVLFFLGPVYLFMVFGLIIMIFLHELGHFMTAKWTGMKPTEFFIGFGSTIFAFKRGEVTYGVKAIPAGAYVRIIGMNNLDPVDPEDEDRAYMNKSYPRRMLVITAGSVMHMVQAFVIFVLLYAVIGVTQGMPGYDDSGWQISEVLEGSPAEEAGLLAGDRIVELDGTDVGWGDILVEVQDQAGETLTATIERGEQVFTVPITLATKSNGDGQIGVAREFSDERQTPGIGTGLDELGTAFTQSITGVPRIFSPSTLGGLAGDVASPREAAEQVQDSERPVGLIAVVGIAGGAGDYIFPLYLLGVVNMFIGIFNMVPLLPLDGGHAAIATYERIRSRRNKPYRADVAKLIPLTYAVVGVIAFIFFTTTILDIFLVTSSS